MKNLKEVIIFLIIAVGVAYPLFYWDILPSQVPIHFDINGDANDWTDKGIGLFILPIISVFINLLLIFIPYAIEEENRPKAIKILYGVRLLMTLLMTFIQIMTIQYTLGNKMDFEWIIFAFLGAVFILVGNYSIHIKPNLYFGIRTPWTLADPENWRLTHEMGGKFMFAGGALVFILSLFLRGKILIYIDFPLIFSSVFIPVLYSYKLYKDKQ